jgi:hypothetical protein
LSGRAREPSIICSGEEKVFIYLFILFIFIFPKIILFLIMGFYVFENHVLVLLLISVLSHFCLWKCHSENQGPWAASEFEGKAAEPAQGSQGGSFPPPCRQGHRRCTQQALQDVLSLSLVLFSKSKVFVSDIAVGIFWGVSWVIQKGGEAVDCAGVDGDIAEAGSSEGSLQEEEVPASRSASQEDEGHSEKASMHQVYIDIFALI